MIPINYTIASLYIQNTGRYRLSYQGAAAPVSFHEYFAFSDGFLGSYLLFLTEKGRGHGFIPSQTHMIRNRKKPGLLTRAINHRKTAANFRKPRLKT